MPQTQPRAVLSVAISPDPATELDATPTAVPSGWDDPDGDPEDYLYEWLVDGSPTGSGPCASTRGQQRDFRWVPSSGYGVTPWDGQVYGSPVASESVDDWGFLCAGRGVGRAAHDGLCLRRLSSVHW